MPGAPDTPEQRIAAAVLAVPGGIASHRSAARLWGIPRPEGDPVDVTVHRSTSRRRITGVVFHRPRDRDRLIPSRRDGVRCTNLLRTLVDLGAVDPAGVLDAVGHAIAARTVHLAALESVVADHAQRGRFGVAALRDAVDRFTIDQKPADSLLESAMYRLVGRYSLPQVEFHPVIEGWEVDFRVVGTAVILECDGWAYHGLQRAQFERDRERDADLAAAGWVVMRFTYRAVTSEPWATARRIRAVLERWEGVEAPDAR